MERGTVYRRQLIVAALATLASCARQAQLGNAGGSPDPAAYGAVVQRAYERVRAATAAYHNLDSAVAAGYPAEVPQCLDNPGQGAMGHHHVNRKYISKSLDVEHPQILLYARGADGAYALNGVEYVVPYRLWPRDSVPPTIMGRNLVRSDGLQLWYLHMWVWKPNPAGLFADWNPSVYCRQHGAGPPT